MIGRLVRLVGAVVRIALLFVLVSALASLAVSTGVVETPAGEDVIETPEPLPDWPFVWEVPVGDGLDVVTDPRPQAEPDDPGEPIREDPGTTRIDLGDTTVSSAAIEEHVHDRINERRSDAGLSPLDLDGAIAGRARTYSHDMAVRGYFGHVSPEGEGPADRFGELYPEPCNPIGENLAAVGAAGAEDADALARRIVEGWMNSEGHRENVLTGRWDSEGVGVYAADGRVYATQLFCDR